MWICVIIGIVVFIAILGAIIGASAFANKNCQGTIFFDEKTGISHLELDPGTELKIGSHLVIGIVSTRDFNND